MQHYFEKLSTLVTGILLTSAFLAFAFISLPTQAVSDLQESLARDSSSAHAIQIDPLKGFKAGDSAHI